MTFPIIDARLNTGPLPAWLAITLLVLLFIAATIVSAYLAFKLRSAQLRKADHSSATQIEPERNTQSDVKK